MRGSVGVVQEEFFQLRVDVGNFGHDTVPNFFRDLVLLPFRPIQHPVGKRRLLVIGQLQVDEPPEVFLELRENLGVAVSIIIDNRAEMIDEILMSDDGTGGGIRIPSMLIGKSDGDKLTEWYKNASEDEREQMVIMCEFVMPEHDVVDLDFWFTSSSDRAIDFLEDFTKIEKRAEARRGAEARSVLLLLKLLVASPV